MRITAEQARILSIAPPNLQFRINEIDEEICRMANSGGINIALALPESQLIQAIIEDLKSRGFSVSTTDHQLYISW